MTGEQIRSFAEAVPFAPFRVTMASGKSVDVPHPDFIHLYPGSRMLTVYKPDDSFEIIDVLLVTSVEKLPRNGSRARRQKRRR